jgi:hypothetical protein
VKGEPNEFFGEFLPEPEYGDIGRQAIAKAGELAIADDETANGESAAEDPFDNRRTFCNENPGISSRICGFEIAIDIQPRVIEVLDSLWVHVQGARLGEERYRTACAVPF